MGEAGDGGRSGAALQAARDRVIVAIDSPLLRLYTRLRFLILPLRHFERIDRFLPSQGLVLDVACGWGLFVSTFGQTHPGARFVGCDLDEGRLASGRGLIGRLGLPNVTLESADLADWEPPEPPSAAYLFFILHHLPREKAVDLLLAIGRHLPVGGRVVVKEILTAPRWKALFTYLMDVVHAGDTEVLYWSLDELRTVLEVLGYEVDASDITNWTPYPQGLFLAIKRREVDPDRVRDLLCPAGRYAAPAAA
ncbi:MAG: class I SAM-dependent methyltransferase [Myxococcota bacterium]|nr:class I SAM-dependent methyltransferase [Myxococcota bacterium]